MRVLAGTGPALVCLLLNWENLECGSMKIAVCNGFGCDWMGEKGGLSHQQPGDVKQI